jgi:hypothetical protein
VLAERSAGRCRGILARRRVRAAGREARGGDHLGARIVVGGLRRERRDLPRPRQRPRHGPDGAWTSAAVLSHGEYGVAEGLYSSAPVTSDGSGYRIVEGLDLDDRARAASTHRSPNSSPSATPSVGSV